MVEALAELVGASALEGIVASSLEPASQVRGFRYFHGGHPMPNAESIQAASAMLKLLQAETALSLVLFLLSGGGSSPFVQSNIGVHPLENFIADSRDLVPAVAPFPA